MKRILRASYLIAVTAGILSCSVTRHVGEGDYLLTKVHVEVEDRLIEPDDLMRYARQKPRRRLLGTNIPLLISSRANPTVILDTALTANSAEAMQIYMETRGYLSSVVAYTIDTARKKAQVTYLASPHRPYTIAGIEYDFQDRSLRDIVIEESVHSLIRPGELFDAGVLDSERARITTLLKDRGYYNFSVNNISYFADSIPGSRKMDLTMVVKQYLEGYDDRGDAILDDNKVYRLRDIFVHAGYNPTDTIQYKGLNIVYDTKLGVRPEVLRRAVNMHSDTIYDASQVQRTYSNLMLLGYYRSASILFREAPRPAANPDTADTAAYLTCDIFCIPAKRQSFTIELEGTTTSDYYGLSATLGYQNRNIFKGMELFDISLRGGYEFMQVKGKHSSFELGATTSVSFPKFVIPFHLARYGNIYNPRTRVELSYNVQRRPYYHRTLSGGSWGYWWGNGRRSNFILRPVDVNVIKMRSVDSTFLDQLNNPYLRESYKDKVILGLSGAFIYNTQMRNLNTNSVALRANFELAGNLLNGLNHLFRGRPDDYYKLFGVRYAQYLRADVNFAQRFALGEKSSVVYRLYAGWAYSYGNDVTVPFDRFFFSGGANSMRGWLTRTLGPGNELRASGYPRQVGNLKLEANIEGRFPISGIVHGALFFDVGNIWLTSQGQYSPEGTFRLDRFYKQLGFNTGLGVRLDFNLFIFRLDWGVQLHNPNKLPGDRWITSLDINNTTLNFGVGYPF